MNKYCYRDYDVMSEEEIIEANKALCIDHRWLIPYGLGQDDDYDYSYTEYDGIPKGWAEAFGREFCEEMQLAFECLEEDERAEFGIMDIKEKRGSLRVYTTSSDSNIKKVINKFEKMSESTCIRCGRKKEDDNLEGYYSNYGYLCSDCYSKMKDS